MIGSLAYRLEGRRVPAAVAAIFDDARAATPPTAAPRRLWEAEMARRALAPLGVPVILLKGTAFHRRRASTPAAGAAIGDLDILVPRASLDAVEAALLEAGWERVKPDRRL